MIAHIGCFTRSGRTNFEGFTIYDLRFTRVPKSYPISVYNHTIGKVRLKLALTPTLSPAEREKRRPLQVKLKRFRVMPIAPVSHYNNIRAS